MESIRTAFPRALPLLTLMRPHQWIKSGFVVLGLLFSHRWTDSRLVMSVLLACVAFSAMASTVYVINDLIDVVSDRNHPKKRLRPIASRAVPERVAQILAAVLFLVAMTCASLVSLTVVALVLCYAAMNVAYSYGLKHVVIVDVFVISAGFMLRILVGTAGVGIEPSSWLLLCGMMMTLLIGFGKRRAELTAIDTDTSSTRKVLAQYDLPLLDQFLAATAGCAVLSYSLYTVSPETIRLHGTDKLIYTVPFIVYGIFRYLFLLNRRGMGQDTARDLFADRHLLATMVGWIVLTTALLS